jgi:class 3 adenylate cyclase
MSRIMERRTVEASPEDAAAIMDVLRRFDRALSENDLDAAVACFAPEVVSIGTGIDETTFGLGELREQTRRDIGQAQTTGIDYTWSRVYRYGPIAWFSGGGRLWWQAPTGDGSEPVRMTAVFEQRGGAWLAVQVHVSLPASGQAEGQSYPTSIQAIAADVSSERPALAEHAAPDGTVTLMFTDIENSTNITERLGDLRWMEVLRWHNAVIRERVREHGCFEVKSQGDGFMIACQSARRALNCATAVQRDLASRNLGEDEPIRVRMGLHTGEVLKDADDFFGKHVILASRIAGMARGGEILVSSLLRELTESAGDLRFGGPREVELKGLSGRYQIHEVLWDVRAADS